VNSTQFKRTVWNYYKTHGRHDLPWRKTTNSYRILVSEIMLQQTQVSRVIPFYKRFIKEFPTFKSLATASLSEVLRAWQGLGYNRRAKFLWQTAQVVAEKYKNKFPRNPLLLKELPGIGSNTAGSVSAFAFNLSVVFIETNIRRVFIHHFFKNKKSVSDIQILPLIKKTLDTHNSRQWYWALMDYGAYLGVTIENPNRLSKHYLKQSSFKGSDREIRGKIIKILLENPKISFSTLVKKINEPKGRVQKILSQMIKENLIIMNKSHLSLFSRHN
jgi:A/G-specific adenine glycosylase